MEKYFLIDQIIDKTMSYSKTYTGVIVIALAELLKWFGIEVGGEALTTTVLTLFQIGGGILVLWERVKKGGVNILGVKK